ncbi:hypothetical protein ADZ36_25310 [Streptomyces fradiae]|uniref:PQQ-binding-like beta-propeller repeat protein n=2 Tax=Streptomyces TaxID=1883 RepID=A0A420V8E0_9ACTN|nr:hypothetical protein ADZ36_25310 [Streptomyces fradiae]OFA40446.1 hypothetical protein BEN35_25860 [Streptomyces fradiae]PQM24555.1 hypothetical protein Sfr7A_07400 [Streptomyces xinghaiensis]RKM98225.1 hypothetical protein SFRA_006930 [Streptomyces xinghaiensis]
MVAAVLATVLAGGGAWLLYGDGDGDGEKPSAGAPLPGHRKNAEIAWERPAPRIPDVRDTPGTWFTAETVVKAALTEVAGHRLDTGKKEWRVPLRGVACATSGEAVAGRAAVQHGHACELLTVVDLEQGTALWTRRVPVPADAGPEPWELAVTEQTVAVAAQRVTTVYRIADRKAVQQLNRSGDTCRAHGVTGGSRLVARAWCDDGTKWIRVHDPATGKREWSWRVPDGLRVQGIPSVEPLVVVLEGDAAAGTHSVHHLPGEGEPPVVMDLGRDADRETGLCEDVTVCPGAVAGGRTLYVRGVTRDSLGDSSASENAVIAYDLRTGRARWAGEPEAKRTLRPVAEFQGDLVAYEPPTAEKGGALLRFDGATGRRSVYERHPAATSEREGELVRNAVPYLHRGMFFLAAAEIYEWEEGDPETALIAAFR